MDFGIAGDGVSLVKAKELVVQRKTAKKADGLKK
jgi:hypothetical protein